MIGSTSGPISPLSPATPNRHRVSTWSVATLVALAALALGACGGAGASIPTVPPSLVPQVTVGAGMADGTACVDGATLAVFDQLKASGADVQAILTANKDVLLAGVQAMQVNDPTTTTWKNDMVAALQAGDFTKAADLVAEVSSGGISITTC
jgi:hypothetical protein